MTAEAVAVILWSGVTLYAVFGGADFGSGFWDLVAGGPDRGARPRALIDLAIGPVWEANHVWLIFDLVVLWTAFPTAFASIMSTLYVPLFLAALGIVLRGSGFAFRHATTALRARRAAGAVFALSSLVTPFFLGTVVGAIAAGEVPYGGDPGDPVSSWANPVGLACGVLAVAVTAYLAAVFLANDARRHGAEDLVGYFGNRAFGAGVVAGGAAALTAVVVRNDAPVLWDGLTSDGLAFVVASGAAGTAALWRLWRGRLRFTRELAAGAVAAVVWGWGVAQDPYLLPGQVTIADAAGADAALWAVITVFGVAAVLIVPSLVLLYRLDQRSLLEEDDLDALAAENAEHPG